MILLLCLILIRLLPFLTEETLFCTLGLSHINLDTGNFSDINLATSNISQINLGSDIFSPNLTCELPSCDSDLNLTECTGKCTSVKYPLIITFTVDYQFLSTRRLSSKSLIHWWSTIYLSRHPVPDGHHHGRLLHLLLRPSTCPWNLVSLWRSKSHKGNIDDDDGMIILSRQR